MDEILSRLDKINKRLDQVQNNQLPVGDLMGYLGKLDKKYENVVNNKISEISEQQLRLLDLAQENTRQIQQGKQLWQSQFSLLEKQALQYTSLEEKLSDILLTLQNEKMHTRDQLSLTKERIITRLDELQSKMEGRVDNVVPPDNKQKVQNHLLYMIPGINDLVLETKEKIGEQASKMNLLRREMAKSEEYLDEIKKVCTRMDTNLDKKLSQLVEDLTQTTKKHLAEVQNIPALVKSVTRSELDWLDNQMETKWDKSQAKSTEMLTLAQEINIRLQDMRTNESTSTVKVTPLGHTTLGPMLELVDRLDKLQVTIREESDKLEEKIAHAQDSAGEILRNKETCFNGEIGKTSTESNSCFLKFTEDLKILEIMIKESVEQLDASVNQNIASVLSNVTSVGSNVEALTTQLNALKAMTNNIQIYFKRDLEVLTENHTELTENVKDSCDCIKDYMDQAKHEIFAMIEKEAHIVRDRIEGPLNSSGHYSFDFYILEFQSLIKSGKEVMSLPWYINEIKSSVKGSVLFQEEGGMVVYILHGRHPLTVGVKPQVFKKTLKLKASICDINNKTLPNRVIGKSTWTPNEWDISNHIHGGWGHEIGVISCDELLQEGYGDKEDYDLGAILIRYHVTV